MNKHEFAVCVDNHNYDVSLEMRKLYQVIADLDAEKHGQIRVIDESGEDYLYPAAAFSHISLPESVIERVFLAPYLMAAKHPCRRNGTVSFQTSGALR